MITLSTKPVRKLSDQEYARCKKLTFVGEPGYRRGMMQAELIRQRNKPDSTAKAVLAKDYKGIIVGWALIWRPNPKSPLKRWDYYMYVQKSHRKQGIGKRLLSRAGMGKQGRIYVFPHDQLSRRAYENLIDGKRICHG